MRGKRIASGLLLGTAGVVFTAVAVFVAQSAQDQARLTERTHAMADIVCREQLQKIGAVKDLEGGRVVELNVPVVVDKRTALSDASTAIAACPTRTMVAFCIGSGCNDPEGSRPPVTAGRRPAAMMMRMALRTGMPAAPASTATPRPAGPPVAAPVPPRPPGQAVQPAQQPARPLPPGVPAQPVRPVPGMTPAQQQPGR